ncbi:U-box domain-containing protein 16 [Vitis vinifera]|uniref:U-box domain-containing protein 16 n=1 Tax=Vitis vinifera TaxID=29760 RepID=A0A438IVK8_VITVI|nr:U-box domain-containing protein 16 [Vitis vinifera]
MAISPQNFPRKRRPSAGSFISPTLSDRRLVQSLLLVSQEISSLAPLQFLLKRNSVSIIRKSNLLAFLFEELLRNPVSCFAPTAILCFEEMYIVLQRMKTLIEDCSNGSRTWLLMQNESVSNGFHELTLDLSTLLDIIPVKGLDLVEDIEELVLLIRKQCSETAAYVDPTDETLRRDLLKMLDQIKREIVPDHKKLAEIFEKLDLQDSASCSDEIKSLEEEFQNQRDDKSKSEVTALIGLVRYAKCVLFGASTPKSTVGGKNP